MAEAEDLNSEGRERLNLLGTIARGVNYLESFIMDIYRLSSIDEVKMKNGNSGNGELTQDLIPIEELKERILRSCDDLMSLSSLYGGLMSHEFGELKKIVNYINSDDFQEYGDGQNDDFLSVRAVLWYLRKQIAHEIAPGISMPINKKVVERTVLSMYRKRKEDLKDSYTDDAQLDIKAKISIQFSEMPPLSPPESMYS